MSFGYNLSYEVAQLHNNTYDARMRKCEAMQDTIEGYEHQLGVLQKLLTAIAAEKQKDKKRVDLSDENNRHLVDAAREVCPEMLPEGVYVWNTEDSIGLLVDTLTSSCARITRLVSPEMLLLTEELRVVADTARIAADSLKTGKEELSRMVANQRAGK